MKKKLSVFLIVFIVFAFVTSATPVSVSSAPLIPPTAEGPGFILPDSPFFFLDKIKQNLRLFISIRPTDRAEVLNSIAGERYAELRFMLAKDNKKEIEYALRGVAEYTKAAADNLSEAKLHGDNVEELAESINTDIKRRQEGLDVLLAEATGELKTVILGAQTSIYESKSKVIQGLSPSKIEIEMNSDLVKKIDTRIKGSQECSQDLLKEIVSLKKKINPSSEMSIDKDDSANKIESVVDEEKRKKLNKEYIELEKIANQCIEVYSEFKSTYTDFNNLLNSKTSIETSEK